MLLHLWGKGCRCAVLCDCTDRVLHIATVCCLQAATSTLFPFIWCPNACSLPGLRVQDAMAAMFNLLQRHSQSVVCSGSDGADAVVHAADAAVCVLHGADLLREASSSCAAVLWLAWRLQEHDSAFAAQQLAGGLCGARVADLQLCESSHCGGCGSWVEQAWQRKVRHCWTHLHSQVSQECWYDIAE